MGDVAPVDPGRGNFRDYVKLPGEGKPGKAFLINRAGFGKAKDLRGGIEGEEEKERAEWAEWIDRVEGINRVEGIGGMLSRKEIVAR